MFSSTMRINFEHNFPPCAVISNRSVEVILEGNMILKHYNGSTD